MCAVMVRVLISRMAAAAVRVAASMVIAARSSSQAAGENYKVLLMRRNSRGSFASAWVFPGGVIEESDSDVSLAGDAPVDASTRLRIGGSLC